MRVLVIGASGAVGIRIVSQLRDGGHQVTGSCRSPGKAARLRAAGADPVVLDALDARAVREAVAAAAPEAVIYQATALAGAGFSRGLDRSFAPTNRLRAEGTDNVVAAARAAGVGRLIAQSFAPYRYARSGGPVKTEVDPLDTAPPASRASTTRRSTSTWTASFRSARAPRSADGVTSHVGVPRRGGAGMPAADPARRLVGGLVPGRPGPHPGDLLMRGRLGAVAGESDRPPARMRHR